jgi:hypothetical protein
MRIRTRERQTITDILREELEGANQRISERIVRLECEPVLNTDGSFDGVRRFYEDLVEKDWTAEDERTLKSLAEHSEAEVKAMMREGFRKSRVHPIPSFSSLINVMRKPADEHATHVAPPLHNIDAISAAERERIANLLHRELNEAAHEVASRLQLSGSKADIVREQLAYVEGAVIGEFTPLV